MPGEGPKHGVGEFSSCVYNRDDFVSVLQRRMGAVTSWGQGRGVARERCRKPQPHGVQREGRCGPGGLLVPDQYLLGDIPVLHWEARLLL